MPGFPPSFEEMGCTAMGGTTVFLSNWFAGMPSFSRLPRYALFLTGGYFVGVYATKFKEQKLHQREVFVWDYIKQHPEDFPEINQEGKKLKDVLETWHPIR